jgi:hypothetical protein
MAGRLETVSSQIDCLAPRMNAPLMQHVGTGRIVSGRVFLNGAVASSLPASTQHRIAEVFYPAGVLALALLLNFAWVSLLVWSALWLLY